LGPGALRWTSGSEPLRDGQGWGGGDPEITWGCWDPWVFLGHFGHEFVGGTFWEAAWLTANQQVGS